MAKRRKFTDQFKAQVALEALRGDRTVQEIAAKHKVQGGCNSGVDALGLLRRDPAPALWRLP